MKQRTYLAWTLFLMLFSALVLLPYSGEFDTAHADILSDFLNIVPSDFDPVGKYLLEPIENKIPGLDLKGFIRNKSSFVLHSNPHEKTNLPPTDYDLQNSIWLMQLEGDYNFDMDTQLVVITQMVYDAAYDWDGDFRDSFNDSDRTYGMEIYNQGKQIIRELYLDIKKPKWNLRIGKQQVVWGRVDGARVMDIINPDDMREGFDCYGNDMEYTRIPLWMMNFKYLWDDYNVQVLLIPDFEETIAAVSNTPWNWNPPALPPYMQLKMISKDEPEDFSPEDMEFAIRFGFLKNGWDVHLSYFYTWKDLPVMFTRQVIPPAGTAPTVSDPLTLVIEPTHTRIHQIGANFEKAIYVTAWDKQVVFRGEGLYTINDYFQDVSDADDGQTRKNWLLLAAPVIETTFFTDWMVSLRMDNRVIMNHNDSLRELPIGKRLDEWQTSFTFALMKSFYNDRANITSWVSYVSDDGDWWERVILTYNFTDHISVQLGFSGFSGNSDDFFGQFDKRDNIEFGIKYIF